MVAVWVLCGLIGAAALCAAVAYVCYRMAFYAKPRVPSEEFELPPGKEYEPFHERMLYWMKEMRATPYRAYTITSFDGLQLYGRYYESVPGAPIEIMMHGYRGSAERDLCGGIQRCFAIGHNALVVDQRASGRSEGHVIGFGVTESRDCLGWIELLVREFGDNVRIILTGISMGAATVMIAAGEPLPDNVVGVLADCGYTSARAIIKKVIRQMGLPANLLYPFVRLGARLYGGYDLEERSPIEAMSRCRIPVIFFHGEADGFVPCEMSRENYEACAAPKRLMTVPQADHGLSYPAAKDAYLQAASEFFMQHGIPSERM